MLFIHGVLLQLNNHEQQQRKTKKNDKEQRIDQQHTWVLANISEERRNQLQQQRYDPHDENDPEKRKDTSIKQELQHARRWRTTLRRAGASL